MRVAPALPGTLAGAVICCVIAATPWTLLVISVVLTALLGFVYGYVRLSKHRRDALLELIRTFQRR